MPKPLIEGRRFWLEVGSSNASVAFTEASRGLAGPLPKFAWREAIDSAQEAGTLRPPCNRACPRRSCLIYRICFIGHCLSPVIVCCTALFARLCPASHEFASASSRAFQQLALRRRAACSCTAHHRSDHKTMAGVKAVIRLRCPAGVAKPGPAIGQALGPHGLNMMDFVKEFNAATQKMEPNSPIPVVLTAYANRTFSFVTKTPPTSYLVRKALGIDKGAQNPGDEVVGTLNMEQVAAIAEVKKGDAHLANIPFDALCDSVIGTARSMGVLLADDVDDASSSSSSSSSSDEDDDEEPGR